MKITAAEIAKLTTNYGELEAMTPRQLEALLKAREVDIVRIRRVLRTKQRDGL